MKVSKQELLTRTSFKARYDLNGNALINNDDTSTTDRAFIDHKHVARGVRKYYKEITNMPNSESKSFGIGPAVAIFEIAAASMLAWKFFSPGTVINAFTSVVELVENWLGYTSFFDTKKISALRKELEIETNSKTKDKEKIEELEDRIDELKGKESEPGEPLTPEEKAANGMAASQIIIGGTGLVGFVWDLFKSKNEKKQNDVPLYQKILLSAASSFNAVLMFFSAGEKCLMSTFAENRGNEKLSKFKAYENMRINGGSDQRCFVEWAGMALVPWFFKANLFKIPMDLLLIYAALREGSKHFVDKGIYPFMSKNSKYKLENSPVAKTIFETFVDPLSVLRTKDANSQEQQEENKPYNNLICDLFNPTFMKKWYLGTEEKPGARERFVIPVAKLFGCNPPKAHIENGNVTCVTEEVEEVNSNDITNSSEVIPLVLRGNLQRASVSVGT